jgi:hypothetical protein
MIRTIEFSVTLAPLTGGTWYAAAPYGAEKWIRVIPEIPLGCNGMVDLAYWMKGRKMSRYPEEGFYAKDDFREPLPADIPCMEGDELGIQLDNRDGVNAHTISLTWEFEVED